MFGNAITIQMIFQPSSVHVLDSFIMHWLTLTNQLLEHKVAVKAFRYPDHYCDSEKVRDTRSAYLQTTYII